MAWVRGDGGCLVGSAAAGKRCPCDQEYVNRKANKVAIVYTSMERHTKMPQKVRTMAELRRLAGGCRIITGRYKDK